MHNSLMFMCLMFTVAVIFQCFIYNILLIVCVQRSSCNCFLLTINKVVLIQARRPIRTRTMTENTLNKL